MWSTANSKVSFSNMYTSLFSGDKNYIKKLFAFKTVYALTEYY